jgi:hypothetical protein
VASSTYVSPLMHYTPFTISTHIRRSASKPCFVNWVMESGGLWTNFALLRLFLAAVCCSFLARIPNDGMNIAFGDQGQL